MNFPAIPSDWIEIEWAPIFIEPIRGSGERMVAGLVGFANGSVVTLPAVSRETAAQLFGNHGAELAALIDDVLTDADACLTVDQDLRAWTPVFEGVEVGGLSKAKGRTAQEALQRALGSHSYLCALTGGWASDETSLKTDATVAARRHPTIRAIREIIDRRPHFKAFVNNTLPIRGASALRWRYDFYGERLAAAIKPFSGTSRGDNVIEQSIFQLSVLGKTRFSRDQRSLILIRPEDSGCGTSSSRKQIAARLNGIQRDCELAADLPGMWQRKPCSRADHRAGGGLSGIKRDA